VARVPAARLRRDGRCGKRPPCSRCLFKLNGGAKVQTRERPFQFAGRVGDMAYLNEMDSEVGYLPMEEIKAKGLELQSAYQNGTPFPNIVIDDFLPDALIEKALAEFPKVAGQDAVSFDRDQERYKTQFQPDELSPSMRAMFYAFNSRPFIRILENITGIKGLIPDPYFIGGGFHEILEGGHLSIHADFNHHLPMNLERRINVLIYLNKDWKDEYGGQLELWDRDMQRKAQSIVPLFNRCVIFNTDSTSYHGNPERVRHPHGVSRKSIALYYYTATWDGLKPKHSTRFRVRAGSQDKVDWRVRLNELYHDWMPPAVIRSLRKLKSGGASRAQKAA
jgi:Rps23 Pro-64 3,4-dihydroxylase Tpa1-like proline 4-hydroxylase